jgi:hypothetical protein
MGCACGKNRLKATRQPAPQYVYDFTAPGTDSVTTYSTPLEAKQAVRRNGGGVIRRREVNTTAPA